MATFLLVLPLVGLVAIVAALLTYWFLERSQPVPGPIHQAYSEIGHSVLTFLVRSDLVFALFSLLAFWALSRWLSAWTGLAFLTGCLLAALGNLLAIWIGSKANAWTVQAAAFGKNQAFNIAFSAASIPGLILPAISLITVSLWYSLYLKGIIEPVDLVGLVLGASCLSVFSRLAGGVFHKAADLTAHVVAGMPDGAGEDDPINPASLLEKAGHYVGNLSGTAAEAFELHLGSMVATMLIASSGIASIVNITPDTLNAYMSFPVYLMSIGLIASTITVLVRYLLPRLEPSIVFRLSGLLGNVILLVGAFLLVNAMQMELGVFYAVVFGAVCGIVLSLLTEWYTSGAPVRRVAEASEIGATTNILAGLTAGMQSTVLPILTICGVVLVAYNYAGIYGIGVAALSLLATSATGLSFYSLGAIADASSGVARMTFQPQSAISVIDRLDAFGNTVSAVGKSFAVGASALVALALFSAYNRVVGLPALDLANPTVIVGFFLGGVLPFLIVDTTVSSIGKVAFRLIEQIQRELHKRREGHTVETSATVTASWLSLQEMAVPVIVSLGSPVAVGLILGRAALGGMLAGALLTSTVLALFMVHAGTAWNNARRLVEMNGGRTSALTLSAATTGDLVGDPLRDVSGPSISMLMRLIAILALVCAPLVA